MLNLKSNKAVAQTGVELRHSFHREEVANPNFKFSYRYCTQQRVPRIGKPNLIFANAELFIIARPPRSAKAPAEPFGQSFHAHGKMLELKARDFHDGSGTAPRTKTLPSDIPLPG
jgi:hypothetical protein